MFCSGAHRGALFWGPSSQLRASRAAVARRERFNICSFCRFPIHIWIHIWTDRRVCACAAAEMNLELLGEISSALAAASRL